MEQSEQERKRSFLEENVPPKADQNSLSAFHHQELDPLQAGPTASLSRSFTSAT